MKIFELLATFMYLALKLFNSYFDRKEEERRVKPLKAQSKQRQENLDYETKPIDRDNVIEFGDVHRLRSTETNSDKLH